MKVESVKLKDDDGRDVVGLVMSVSTAETLIRLIGNHLNSDGENHRYPHRSQMFDIYHALSARIFPGHANAPLDVFITDGQLLRIME